MQFCVAAKHTIVSGFVLGFLGLVFLDFAPPAASQAASSSACGILGVFFGSNRHIVLGGKKTAGRTARIASSLDRVETAVRLLPCFAVRVRLFREAQLSWTSTAGDCSLGALGLIMILAHCHYLLELLDTIRYQRKAPLSFTACFVGLGAFFERQNQMGKQVC